MENSEIKFNENGAYIFSEDLKDWYLVSSIHINKLLIKIKCHEHDWTLNYFAAGGVDSIMTPIFKDKHPSKYIDFLRNLEKHINNKLLQIKENSNISIHSRHFIIIELILFLRIYLDTIVLFVSDKDVDSIANNEFFEIFKIKKTEHMIKFLEIIILGGNNLKHLERTEKIFDILLNNFEKPSIILELSKRENSRLKLSKRENSKNEFIVQPIKYLMYGTSCLVFCIFAAYNGKRLN